MKVTVILTSYNHGKFLRESIESVLAQTYQDFEFIIVDDCSTDSSWNIICEYKDKYPELVTIRHSYNWGAGNVEDTVLNYATGDYIAIHHSDDIWENQKLEKQVGFLLSHPNYGAVFTNAQCIDDEGNNYDENGFYQDLFSVENRSRQQWLRYFFEYGNCLCHPSILIKKSIYVENNFFKKGMRQIPDFVKWISVCKKYEIFVLPERLVKFRVHSEGKNTSGMRADTQIRSTVELYWMLNEYRDIKEKKEFLKIFPEADTFCRGKEFVPEYALGKICTQPNVQPYTRLFGETLLFEVLNDPEKAKILQVQYDYKGQDLIGETGKYDIFGILPKAFEQVRSIYYDCGNGWEVEKRISEKYTINDKIEFDMKAQIEIGDKKNHRIKFRFDPAEGIMVRVKITQILVNAREVTVYTGENAIDRIDGEDIFINLDPIYSFEEEIMEEIANIEIKGYMYRLTGDEIGALVTDHMYKNRELFYKIKDYEKKVERLENVVKENSDYKTRIERLEMELKQLDAELQQIKAGKIYKFSQKMGSLLPGK